MYTFLQIGGLRTLNWKVKVSSVIVSGLTALGVFTGVNGAANADSQVVIKMWYPWGGIDEQFLKKRIAGFEKLHPNIVIDATLIQGAGVATGKFSTAVASGNPPDLVLYNSLDHTPQFVQQGALTDVTAEAKSVGISPTNYYPGFAKYMTYKGGMYAVPSNAAVYQTLIYNRTTLREAGVNPNFVPKTLQDVEKLESKIDQISGGKVSRATYSPLIDGTGSDINFWAQEFNAKVMSDDGKTVLFNKDPNFKKMVLWLKSQVTHYGAANIQRLAATYSASDILSSSNNMFYKHQIAFITNGSWVGAYAQPFMKKSDIVMVPVPPVAAGEKPLLEMDSDTFWWPKGAQHIKESLEFVKFWDSPDNYAQYADATGCIAASPAAVAKQKLSKDPVFKAVFDALSTGRVEVVPMTKTSQWQQILNTAIYNILYKNANINTTLNQAANQIQGTL